MKKLISAADIKQAKLDKKDYIVAPSKRFIITPEALDIAKNDGIRILEEAPESNTKNFSPEFIKNEIKAQLPNVDTTQSKEIENLVSKALENFSQKVPSCPRQINDDGIVLIQGSAVQLEVFDGAPGKNIGLTDVIGPEDKSNMGVGYMGWENAFFPWTLTYDEINVVLEGELHVKTASGTSIAKPGDIIFIPKGSTVEFGTPTHVRYIYITYPADWS
ncbi:ethanolamine utilization acetate kinase EutQ [Psychromonas hadalis]|uniref:ethanolamine utilization acetate kinase EutQ n=1 Tax=Psychromonas hadalis TaxID=211669 RepID=UPI0003B557E2|nr:ethanolamine utilization acetate kinase EutQ [Psychromonas hadalis]